MDGEAITAAFASCPGADSLKDVFPKLGQRLKVYTALKTLNEELQVLASQQGHSRKWPGTDCLRMCSQHTIPAFFTLDKIQPHKITSRVAISGGSFETDVHWMVYVLRIW